MEATKKKVDEVEFMLQKAQKKTQQAEEMGKQVS